MSGETQRFWLHSIRKETRQVAPRINLTFRRIFNESSAGARSVATAVTTHSTATSSDSGVQS